MSVALKRPRAEIRARMEKLGLIYTMRIGLAQQM